MLVKKTKPQVVINFKNIFICKIYNYAKILTMINFDLNNRTAIVTGGAQGFGYAVVKRFLNSGAKVIIWDIDKKFIEIALKDSGSEKLSYQIVDITNFEEIKKNFNDICKDNKIDIFVNNAGVAGLNDKVWNLSLIHI